MGMKDAFSGNADSPDDGEEALAIDDVLHRLLRRRCKRYEAAAATAGLLAGSAPTEQPLDFTIDGVYRFENG